MILRPTRMFASGCSLLGVATLTAVLTASPAVADKGPSGSAYALSVATTLLDHSLVNIDPRPAVTYPRGGSDSVVKIGPDAAGLVTANGLTASSAPKGRTLAGHAAIADVTVKDILSASVITADCTAGANGLTGTSSVANLTVLGHRIDVTTSREIDVLGVAKVRVNEQVRTGDTLKVNAVHVIVGGPVGTVASADIVLSQVKCVRGGGTEPSEPTTTTTAPTTTTTPPGSGEPSEPPAGTDSSTPATSTTSKPASSTSGHGITTTSNDDDLAETGAAGIVPISLAGLVLLAGGGSALLVAKRRRAANRD